MNALKIALSASLLFAAAGAAVAGNYAEGDPRPVAIASTVSQAAVADETRRWAQGAPTLGYPEGNPRAVVVASQASRAAVVADTVLWNRSGLAAQQYGEVGGDRTQVAYRQAEARYLALRASPANEALVNRNPARTPG